MTVEVISALIRVPVIVILAAIIKEIEMTYENTIYSIVYAGPNWFGLKFDPSLSPHKPDASVKYVGHFSYAKATLQSEKI